MWGAVIGAGISAIGGMMANNSAKSEAKRADLFARENYRHAHQWEVQDLRKAGLNPILSANNGSNFSTVPMASQSNPFSGAEGIGDTLNSSRKIDEVDKEAIKIQSKTADANIGLAKASEGAQDAMARKTAQEEVYLAEQAAATRINSANNIMQRENIIKQGAVLDAQAIETLTRAEQNRALTNSARSQKEMVDIDIEANKDTKQLLKGTEAVGGALDVLYKLRGLVPRQGR